MTRIMTMISGTQTTKTQVEVLAVQADNTLVISEAYITSSVKIEQTNNQISALTSNTTVADTRIAPLDVDFLDNRFAANNVALGQPVSTLVAMNTFSGTCFTKIIIAPVAFFTVVVHPVDSAVARVTVDSKVDMGVRKRGHQIFNSRCSLSWGFGTLCERNKVGLIGLMLHNLFTDSVAELRGKFGAGTI
jgi:hypothetical protein